MIVIMIHDGDVVIGEEHQDHKEEDNQKEKRKKKSRGLLSIFQNLNKEVVDCGPPQG